MKDTIKTINNLEVTWTLPEEEEERLFEVERAQVAARSAFSQSHGASEGRKGGRAGRGGGWGRGRGRGRGGRKGGQAKSNSDEKEEPSVGDKRKRAIEPDGAPDAGIRGNHAPPVVQATKKVKTDAGGEGLSASDVIKS